MNPARRLLPLAFVKATQLSMFGNADTVPGRVRAHARVTASGKVATVGEHASGRTRAAPPPPAAPKPAHPYTPGQKSLLWNKNGKWQDEGVVNSANEKDGGIVLRMHSGDLFSLRREEIAEAHRTGQLQRKPRYEPHRCTLEEVADAMKEAGTLSLPDDISALPLKERYAAAAAVHNAYIDADNYIREHGYEPDHPENIRAAVTGRPGPWVKKIPVKGYGWPEDE